MQSIMRAIVVLAISFVLASCQRIEAVQNVTNNPIPRELHKLPLDTIEAQIAAGGSAGTWRVIRTTPGKLSGTVAFKHHSATVDILVTQQSYSINYVSSSNLRERNDEVHTIHREYNRQVQTLQRNIDAHLAKYAASNPS